MSRVLLHSLAFSPDGVSTAHLMTDLALELKRLGHIVTVLTTTPHYNVLEDALERQPLTRRWAGLLYSSHIDGIAVWHVKVPMKGQRVWLRVLDYLRFHVMSLVIAVATLGAQDVVIATSPPLTMGLMSWLLATWWGAASVYKVAEVYPDLAIRQGMVRNRGAIAALRSLERFVYARNKMIVPIAEQFAQVIRQRGVSAAKVRVIHDSVDTALYRPLPRDTAFAQHYGLGTDFVVLYAGNIGIVQDWESVLAAAERLTSQPVKFVIVGDGARRPWLEEAVRTRGLSKVLLIGYQPKERMSEITASCDIATIPMTRAGMLDGFPSKIYSIMACAKPVIACGDADSDMARFIRGAGCGRVVPPENPDAFTEAVRRAFDDRASLAAEGHRGRAVVEEEYSRPAIARRYDDLVQQLAAESSKGRSASYHHS